MWVAITLTVICVAVWLFIAWRMRDEGMPRPLDDHSNRFIDSYRRLGNENRGMGWKNSKRHIGE